VTKYRSSSLLNDDRLQSRKLLHFILLKTSHSTATKISFSGENFFPSIFTALL
jgi:hypothetical protein